MQDKGSKITALKLNLDSVANYSSTKGLIYLNHVLRCSSINWFCEQIPLVTENNLLLELRYPFFIPPTLILLKTKLSHNYKLSKNKEKLTSV